MKHIPVLLDESLNLLNIQPDHYYIDATFGRGGHTSSILDKGAKVVAFDWDPEAIEFANIEFAKEISEKKLIIIPKNFSEIQTSVETIKQSLPNLKITGILFDFGTSTEQLKSSERGFSFEGDGPLDMRMNPELGVTASDLLMAVPEVQLAQLFIDFGGEERGKAIARAIKKSPAPIKTTSQLKEIAQKVYGGRHGKLHPATKVFQALRIAVNSELDHIKEALPQAFAVLETGGVLTTIAFHEGEDRLAKKFMKDLADSGKAEIHSRITAPEFEIKKNPRSRSAVLRAITKV